MSRPVWTGHISFGLVNVPVSLHSAEHRTDLELHMIDSRNQARVRYERVNEETGQEVPWNSIVKGYEYSDGNYVVLTEKELKSAAPEATRTIDIETFVPLEEISPLYFDKPYYIVPGPGGGKGYVLLRDSLKDGNRVGIARVVIRTRQYIAALMPRDAGLVLMLLRYTQELRSMSDLDIGARAGKARISAAEKKMAKQLIDGMTTAWKPESFHDEYRDQLMKWIQKRIKASKGQGPEPEPEAVPDEPPESFNFVELLKKSVAQTGRTGRKRRPAPKKAPARRAAG